MVITETNQNGFVAIGLLLIFIPIALSQTYLQRLIFTQTRTIKIHSLELNDRNRLNENTAAYLNQVDSTLLKAHLKARKGVLSILKLDTKSPLANLVFQNTSTNQIDWENFSDFERYRKSNENLIYPLFKIENFLVQGNTVFDNGESVFNRSLTIKQNNNALGLIFLGSLRISELNIIANRLESNSIHTFIIAENEIEILNPLLQESDLNTDSNIYLLSNNGTISIQNNSSLKGCNCSEGAVISCLIINKYLFPSSPVDGLLNFNEKCILPIWPSTHETNEVIGRTFSGDF